MKLSDAGPAGLCGEGKPAPACTASSAERLRLETSAAPALPQRSTQRTLGAVAGTAGDEESELSSSVSPLVPRGVTQGTGRRPEWSGRRGGGG